MKISLLVDEKLEKVAYLWMNAVYFNQFNTITI